jgi:hypothetical protein
MGKEFEDRKTLYGIKMEFLNLDTTDILGQEMLFFFLMTEVF